MPYSSDTLHTTISTLYKLGAFFESNRVMLATKESHIDPALGFNTDPTFTDKLLRDLHYQASQHLPRCKTVLRWRDEGQRNHQFDVKETFKLWGAEMIRLADVACELTESKISKKDMRFTLPRGANIIDVARTEFDNDTLKHTRNDLNKVLTAIGGDRSFEVCNLIMEFDGFIEALNTLKFGSGFKDIDKAITEVATSSKYFNEGYPKDLLSIPSMAVKRFIASKFESDLKPVKLHINPEYSSAYLATANTVLGPDSVSSMPLVFSLSH